MHTNIYICEGSGFDPWVDSCSQKYREMAISRYIFGRISRYAKSDDLHAYIGRQDYVKGSAEFISSRDAGTTGSFSRLLKKQLRSLSTCDIHSICSVTHSDLCPNNKLTIKIVTCFAPPHCHLKMEAIMMDKIIKIGFLFVFWTLSDFENTTKIYCRHSLQKSFNP